jgi:rubrerythrin
MEEMRKRIDQVLWDFFGGITPSVDEDELADLSNELVDMLYSCKVCGAICEEAKQYDYICPRCEGGAK